MEFSGELETHLTVSLKGTESIRELQKLAEIHNLKCLHIILERGDTTSQPMLTWRAQGGLTSQTEKAQNLKEIISAAGFPVIRTKIEAAPWNEDVPQTESELQKQSDGRYFESHIRILLDLQAKNRRIKEIAERHSAHFSRNAFREPQNGFEERFVTQRNWNVWYSESNRKLNDLLNEIKNSGYTVIDVEEEFVVFDSNLEIDRGWIKEEE